jgi:hypothetical protein
MRSPRKQFSLTKEMEDRLDRARSEGVNMSDLVEQLLRGHFGMALRPEMPVGHRWEAGESGNPALRPKKKRRRARR